MANILLLEDDLSLAMHYRGKLESVGHLVYHEVNVNQAKHTLEEVGIEIVVCDIMIRSQNGQPSAQGGFSLLSHITLNVRPVPHVIVVTGMNAQYGVMDVAGSFNAVLAMQKPIDVDELVREVGELSKRPLQRSTDRGIGNDSYSVAAGASGLIGSFTDVDDTLTPPD